MARKQLKTKPVETEEVLVETVDNSQDKLLEQIKVLEEEKSKLQKALDKAHSVNGSLSCLSDKVENYLNFIQKSYVKDGRWVNLNLLGFVIFGKETFTFVKSTLAECFGIEFESRIPSWATKFIDKIVKFFT